MKRGELTQREQAIERALIKGEYKDIRRAEFKKIAQAVANHIITRQCVICARRFEVSLHSTRRDHGGYYFGTVRLNNQNVEYWECPKCYRLPAEPR